VIVRADLPKGLQGAQICHASGESAANGDVPEGTHAVVLQVDNEEDLLGVADQLWSKVQLRNDDYVVIVEPDLPNTGHAYAGQFTAIGIRPTQDRKKLASVIGRLALLR